jgi:hypothetical protein
VSTTQELVAANQRYENLRAGIQRLCDAEDARVKAANERLTAERGEPPYGPRWCIGGILPVEKVRALLESA